LFDAQGGTVAYFDKRRLYAGKYLVLIGNVSRRVVLVKIEMSEVGDDRLLRNIDPIASPIFTGKSTR